MDMKLKLANRDVRKAVESLCVFTSSTGSLFSKIDEEGRRYVVYSYGAHWPLFVYDMNSGEWYENVDKYGVTTSRHLSSARPNSDCIIELSRGEMLSLINGLNYLE